MRYGKYTIWMVLEQLDTKKYKTINKVYNALRGNQLALVIAGKPIIPFFRDLERAGDIIKIGKKSYVLSEKGAMWRDELRNDAVKSYYHSLKELSDKIDGNFMLSDSEDDSVINFRNFAAKSYLQLRENKSLRAATA